MDNNRTFKLGDVVLITDTYDNRKFTAHCIQKIETLNNDGEIQDKFTFAVSQNPDDNLSYIVGEDRSDNVYDFGKVICNILEV